MKQKRNRRSVFKVILLLLTVVIASYFFLHSPLFVIKEVQVKGNKLVSKSEIIGFSGIETGTNIFLFRSEAAVTAVEVIPRIKSAEIKRELPNTVVIKVAERKPWAVLVAGGDSYIIDGSGVCFDKSAGLANLDLPLITWEGIPSRFSIGQPVDAQVLASVKTVLNALPAEVAQRISEYHCTGDNQVIMYTLDRIEIRFGPPERVAEKIALLEQALALDNRTGSNEALKYIDLRYKGQPVISYR